MKKLFFLLLMLPSVCYALASNNLVFQDRFNGDLSAWTEIETGGSVDLQARNDTTFFSPQMKLNDTSASDNVSATHAFTEPSTAYNIEYDEIIVTDGDVCIMNLLDGADNIIASVTHGATNDTVSFDTDNATASTATWNNNTRKQVVLSVDVAGNTIGCWISQDDATYGSFVQIGTDKSYTGATITKIQFSTSTGTSVAYIDEVRIYTPDIAFIGDSITDGKPYWSTHPAYPTGRIAAQEDESSPPTYHMNANLNGHSGTWVMNRGFGGSYTAGVDTYIQTAVIDQNAQQCFVGVGHNDIMDGIALATMQTNILSIIGKLESAGITGREIVLGNIMPSSYIDTTSERYYRDVWNVYLRSLCLSNGYVYVDRFAALKSSSNREVLAAAYNSGDGCHLALAGSEVFADTVYAEMSNMEYKDADDGNNYLLPADCTANNILYPHNQTPVCVSNYSGNVIFF